MISHAQNDFSVPLWLLSAFFLNSLESEAMKLSFCQKHLHERIATSNFEFTQHFFSCRAWSVMRETIFKHCCDYCMTFFVLIVIRRCKAHFLSKSSLRMHCNFKILAHSNSFLVTGHNQPRVIQNIKALRTRKVQNAIAIRRRKLTHRTPCKNRVCAVFFHQSCGQLNKM